MRGIRNCRSNRKSFLPSWANFNYGLCSHGSWAGPLVKPKSFIRTYHIDVRVKTRRPGARNWRGDGKGDGCVRLHARVHLLACQYAVGLSVCEKKRTHTFRQGSGHLAKPDKGHIA